MIIEDVISKQFKDLNDTEKAFIVKELSIYALSDSYVDLQKKLEEEAEEIRESIKVSYAEANRSRDLIASQSDKEWITKNYMEEIANELDESNGAIIFKVKLIEACKSKEKTNIDTIEPMFDQYCYTALDMLKLSRVLRLSVKHWLSQTIQQHEKEVAVPEEKGAY